jgi:hypothetical protein
MNLRETIRKVLREDYSQSEEVLGKMINKIILKKGDYPWVEKLYSVELTEETEHHRGLTRETWGSRILIQFKPEYFTNLSKNWGNYTSKEDMFIYYGMEIDKRFIDNSYKGQPSELATEIENLSQRIGFEPHYSLFNTYYVIPPTEEELNNKPAYI